MQPNVLHMDTDQTSTEQTCGRTDQNGKKYAQHHIQRKKDQHLGQGEDKRHRYNQHCKKNEIILGRAYHPFQRRPMDLTCHHLETIYDKKSRQGRPAKRWRDDLDKYWSDTIYMYMAEDSTMQGNLETTC